MREHRAGGTLICHSSCHGPGAGAGGCCSGAPAGPSLLLGTGAEAPAVLSQCSVAAGSDPGAVAREKSASICHHERVAKLSPKLKMGLRDSPDRAGLESLATMLEVSVLPPLEVSQICAPRVVTPGLEWELLGILAVCCSSNQARCCQTGLVTASWLVGAVVTSVDGLTPMWACLVETGRSFRVE